MWNTNTGQFVRQKSKRRNINRLLYIHTIKENTLQPSGTVLKTINEAECSQPVRPNGILVLVIVWDLSTKEAVNCKKIQKSLVKSCKQAGIIKTFRSSTFYLPLCRWFIGVGAKCFISERCKVAHCGFPATYRLRELCHMTVVAYLASWKQENEDNTESYLYCLSERWRQNLAVISSGRGQIADFCCGA